MGKLDGQTAIVTGGASGIGRATALRFCEEGATVLVADIDTEGAEQVVAELPSRGDQVIALAVDVSQLPDIDRMVEEAVSIFGRIDILFNNAGISHAKPFLEVTPQEWDRQFAVNAKGAFFVLQAVARQMCQQAPVPGRGVRGKIINTASLAAFRPAAVTAAYSATKAVVVNFTWSAAQALAPYRINVNAICPGYVETPIYDIVAPQIEAAYGWEAGEYRPQRAATIPWERFAQPEEVAGLCVFLAGPDSDYMTGQAINFDGGVNMR